MADAKDEKERALRELIAVLQLEKLARAAYKKDELAFLIVNDTHKISPYEQSILWSYDVTGRIMIEAVSGVARPDSNSPYLQSLVRLIKHLVESDKALSVYEIIEDNLSDALAEDWKVSGLCSLWCPFVDEDKSLTGGIWINSRAHWQQKDLTRMEFIVDAYSYCWHHVNKVRYTWRKRLHDLRDKLLQKRTRLAVSLAVIVFMFIPVSQTVTAPAEVVAIKPVILSPPVDGIVKKFHVRPNAFVTEGQVLFSLEDSNIKNRYEVGQKELDVALADFKRASAKAFADEKTREEVNLLRSVVEQKKVEVIYAKELLQRINVKATRDGIAVYSDESDWVGKPVKVGQKIITLADPAATELLVWVPVDDAIAFEDNARVRGFLNVDPTSPIDAELRQLSYEAQLSPDNVLSFKLYAKFSDDVSPPRIGLRATAKAYGESVTLFYYIFRKPISALRRYLGL